MRNELDRNPDSDVVTLLRTAAVLHRQRTALAHRGRRMSYEELLERVEHAAAAMPLSHGTVGILVANAPETIIAVLAALFAGLAYCPIDPSYPAQRQLAMLRQAGAEAVVLTAPGQVPPYGWPAIVIPSLGDAAARGRPVERFGGAPPDRPAYVMFTSGSSGQPKAVEVSCGALACAAVSLRELLGLDARDRTLQLASLSWDTCLEEILPTLLSGASLVLDDATRSGSLFHLLRFAGEAGITYLNMPTALWHELARYLAQTRAGLPDTLRLLVIGGEPARAKPVRDWYALGQPQVRVFNTYGSTETVLVTHAVQIAGDGTQPHVQAEIGSRGRVPIGAALPHVVQRLGTDGELLVGGGSLATRYRGNAVLTDERFVQLPDDGGPACRFFRTRDRVECIADDVLVHAGRLDEQLKIRGVLVDPLEVEAHVAAASGATEVAVCGAEAAGTTRLVALVVAPASGTAPSPQALLARLKALLPSHLVPATVCAVPDLLYTASGKVDRRGSLRRHAGRLNFTMEGFPMTGTDIARIFQDVLETKDPPGDDADFFAMGGDSLLATRVLVRIAGCCGVHFTLADFLEAPTPESLARKAVGAAH